MKKIAIALFAIALSACATGPRRPVVQPIKYDLKINQSSSEELFVDDVGISLKPIMLERAQTTENLFASYNYWNPGNPNQKGRARNILVSLPVFEIQVTNVSGHTANFQKAAIRLIDDAGNSYQAQLKQDVIDFATQQLDSLQSRGWAFDRYSALAGAKNLRLFDKNYESLPGIIEKRILSFDLGNAANENAYREMFKNAKYIRVLIHNVPVKFDQAGNTIKVAKFEYLFDVAKR